MNTSSDLIIKLQEELVRKDMEIFSQLKELTELGELNRKQRRRIAELTDRINDYV